MLSNSTLKKAEERWKRVCETIQTMSTVNVAETKSDQSKRNERGRTEYT